MFVNSQLNFESNPGNYISRLNNIIETIGYVQIDTISIVERSHHHILWTRMSDYNRGMLDELIDKKKVFEYWSHAAAYLPIRDFKYSLIRKKNYSLRHKDWMTANRKLIRYVTDRIKAEGPIQSRDFEETRRVSGGWGSSKPSKEVLNYLFHSGRLMITGRKHFQKIFDLTERVLPEDTDTSLPSESDYYEHMIFSYLRSNGFGSEKEITYLKRYNKKVFSQVINSLIEEGRIMKARISGIANSEYFISNTKLEFELSRPLRDNIQILSPFDNLIIQRKKIKELFSFDYTLECYIPQHKRKFGYYCLPVLSGDSFIGMIDAKREPANKTLQIINTFWDLKKRRRNLPVKSILRKLNQLSEFAGCVKVSGFTPP